jgi:hypothetical protein
MSQSSNILPRARTQVTIFGFAAVGFALVGFQIGRHSLHPVARDKAAGEIQVESQDPLPVSEPPAQMSLDTKAAVAWFDQLQPEARDAAIADFCHSAESQLAEQAIALGLTIRDRTLRDKTLGELARGLGETDEERIEAVNQLSISHQQKLHLIGALRGGAK